MSYVLRNYSVLMLLAEIVFVCTIGVHEMNDQPDSFDQKFKRSCPTLYKYLSYIGFRMYTEPGHQHQEFEQEEFFQWKFLQMVAFLMISMYYIYYFKKLVLKMQQEEDF